MYSGFDGELDINKDSLPPVLFAIAAFLMFRFYLFLSNSLRWDIWDQDPLEMFW